MAPTSKCLDLMSVSLLRHSCCLSMVVKLHGGLCLSKSLRKLHTSSVAKLLASTSGMAVKSLAFQPKLH